MTTSPIDHDRGRSVIPGSRGSGGSARTFSVSPSRHNAPFGSQHLSFRKESSPHVIHDRITRHASPSRRESDQDKPEHIVSKVPQPYRTSFSAVVSPYRLQRSQSPLSGHGSLGLNRDSPGRSTIPVGSLSSQYTKSDDLLARSPQDTSRPMSPLATEPTSNGAVPAFVRSNIRYASTPASLRGKVRVHYSDSTSSQPTGAVSLDRMESTADSVFASDSTNSPAQLNENSVRTFMENSNPDKVLTNGGLTYDSQELQHDTVQIKQLITKEYAHQESVSYFQLLEKRKKKKLAPANEQTKRFVGILLKSGFGRRSQSAERPTKPKITESPEVEPITKTSRSVEDILNDKTIQSNISLPSDALSSTKKPQPEPHVKKSHSSSNIWSSIIRRLSPKTFRRGRRSLSVGRTSEKSSKENTPNGSDTSLHLVPVDINGANSQESLPDGENGLSGKNSKSRQSRRKSPKLSKSKKKKVPTATLR